jgi:hypothetical protein
MNKARCSHVTAVILLTKMKRKQKPSKNKF